MTSIPGWPHGDRSFYLEAWNGTGSFNVDRIGRGELYIPQLCLSVFGGIQPDLLERYLCGIANSLDNDGRIQRFQMMVYPNPAPWQWRDRYPVKGAREAVRDLFDRLATFDPLQDGATAPDDFVRLPNIGFDDDAQEVFISWSTKLHTVLISICLSAAIDRAATRSSHRGCARCAPICCYARK